MPTVLTSGAYPSSRSPHVGGPVLTREQAPIGDSEASTVQTVRKMAEHIRNSAGDPAVAAVAALIARRAGRGAPASELARAVFHFLKSRVRFRTDDDLIALMRIGQDELELLVSPPVLFRHPRPEGDCDDFTMACCALLHELGIPAEIVTVKADQPDPDRWSHVYCCAQTERGPMILDTSHGKAPGWEVPYFYAKRTWDSRTGQPIRSEGGRVPEPRRRSSGLHGYTSAGWGARRRRSKRWGMGDDGSEPSTTDLTPTFTSNDPYLQNPPAGNMGPTSAPSPWAGAFAANLSNIINQGFKTLQLGLVPTGGVLVQGPNGTYTIANNAAPGSLPLGGTSGMSMGTLLLIGGAVVVVAMVAGKK